MTRDERNRKQHADRVAFIRRTAVGKPGCAVDRVEDRARQWCRRSGLALFDKGSWRLTELGERFLRANASPEEAR